MNRPSMKCFFFWVCLMPTCLFAQITGSQAKGKAVQLSEIGSLANKHSTADLQRITQIDFLLSRLDSLQVRRDPVFLPGAYPSYIFHREKFRKKKKDITIFYNILIDATLSQIRAAIPASFQPRIDQLLRRSQKLYPRFKNEARGSYNFWLRDSAYRFPYSWWIPLIKKDGAVPDDMDDTVLSQFVLPQDSLEKLHQQMQRYAHEPGQRLKTTDPAYRKFGAYSTWFGEKFPVVFDVSVLSNILSFVQHYQLQWTKVDSASLRLIVATIKNDDYIHRPLLVSPYYGKTAILLYHFSRLMKQGPLPALDSLRPRLIEQGRYLLTHSKIFMERVITANALIQLGEPAPKLILPTARQWKSQVEKSDYAFFIGNIPSYLPNGIKKILTRINALMYYHFCPAYNDLLVLQYLASNV
ncbi:MAG TPA: hypothetical protein VL053_04355 [Arachidicoccus sp.]|nr:hypothetical protein [Arachidicoccus sp.]